MISQKELGQDALILGENGKIWRVAGSTNDEKEMIIRLTPVEPPEIEYEIKNI